MLKQSGGGIELTTLAAIPKGSGLGTSSIMGAVTLAVIQRVLGKTTTERNLFHDVLRLEQALTTGGGWQDQIGGSVGGTKIIRTRAGLIPDAAIHFLPSDVLDPHLNGGTTLLYYTGITRLAKDILEQVVGRYLDRNRQAMATLHRIHALAPTMADAVSRKDQAAFGRLITTAWELNKELDPNSTNPEVESADESRATPHPRCETDRGGRRRVYVAGVPLVRGCTELAPRVRGGTAQSSRPLLRFRSQPRRSGGDGVLSRWIPVPITAIGVGGKT